MSNNEMRKKETNIDESKNSKDTINRANTEVKKRRRSYNIWRNA